AVYPLVLAGRDGDVLGLGVTCTPVIIAVDKRESGLTATRTPGINVKPAETSARGTSAERIAAARMATAPLPARHPERVVRAATVSNHSTGHRAPALGASTRS